MKVKYKFADGREEYIDNTKAEHRLNPQQGLSNRIRMKEVIEREFNLVWVETKPVYVENPDGLPDWIRDTIKATS